jgi:hypothetical protein
MGKFGLTAVACLLLLGAGAAEWLWSGQKASAEVLNQTNQRLAAIPLTVGGWTGTDLPFDKAQLEQAEAGAYLSRVYRNAATNHVVTVLLLAGHSQAIGAHNPNVCFGNSGFERSSSEVKLPITSYDGQTDTVWTARFETQELPVRKQQLSWGYSTGSVWNAADNPRFEYARQPLLYKLYVARPLSGNQAGNDDDPSKEFLAAFLPVVRTALTGSP